MLVLSTQDSFQDIFQIPGGFLVLKEFPGREPEFQGREIAGSHHVFYRTSSQKNTVHLKKIQIAKWFVQKRLLDIK